MVLESMGRTRLTDGTSVCLDRRKEVGEKTHCISALFDDWASNSEAAESNHAEKRDPIVLIR